MDLPSSQDDPPAPIYDELAGSSSPSSSAMFSSRRGSNPSNMNWEQPRSYPVYEEADQQDATWSLHGSRSSRLFAHGSTDTAMPRFSTSTLPFPQRRQPQATMDGHYDENPFARWPRGSTQASDVSSRRYHAAPPGLGDGFPYQYQQQQQQRHYADYIGEPECKSTQPAMTAPVAEYEVGSYHRQAAPDESSRPFGWPRSSSEMEFPFEPPPPRRSLSSSLPPLDSSGRNSRHASDSTISDVSVQGVKDDDSYDDDDDIDTSNVLDEEEDVSPREQSATQQQTHDDNYSSKKKPKTSRYLREMDRRVILARLANGERQAALAKEFNVSRAAICNLFKHRDVVMARTNEHPFAKHPKKKTATTSSARKTRKHLSASSTFTADESNVIASARASASANATPTTSTTSLVSLLSGASTTKSSSSRPRSRVSSSSSLAPESKPTASPAPAPPRVTLHEVRSQAVQLLLSSMSDQSCSLQEFQRCCDRVLWLVTEEALAMVPFKPSTLDRPQSFMDVAVEQSPCAISMEHQSLNANPMLAIFQLMEPRAPCGAVHVQLGQEAPLSQATAEITDGALPHSLQNHNAFVLDVVAGSGEAVCAVLHRLLHDYGAIESSISVVSLFASSEVVAMVQCKHPGVAIVTARIDSNITRRRVATTAVDLILHRVRQAYQH